MSAAAVLDQTTATPVDEDDDFAPLSVKVVLAAHPLGRLMCSTNDGCGQTCSGGASSCSSLVRDPE
ncbi:MULTISPECIES: FxLD family lanthipeptide [unclassified Streptomyces]|uniref:FxLD family lanthipeptide n=1 Tax=unclassified Streptomyces TaxID=2593676 RepID=UPI000DBAA0D6|nr:MULTISPECIES: FxLD family lanthipeptide [unclassified Streptomyces]MYT68321.1 FxLD family lantipeptide [Streptomyces sp. SID8367]RAJ76957.1 FxLD family lantipeptide [Streptomyces sp. PsTaAH-137]